MHLDWMHHARSKRELTLCALQVGYSAGFWVAMFPDMKTEPAAKFPNIRCATPALHLRCS